jgi:hypothetical protein
MSFTLMEATEEACVSAVTPASMSTATIVTNAAVRRGWKGMLYIWKGPDQGDVEISRGSD